MPRRPLLLWGAATRASIALTESRPTLTEMNERAREVFCRLVETYIATGEPVGSRTIARSFAEGVSAATVRNTMQDLELLGLLDSPQTLWEGRARLPTLRDVEQTYIRRVLEQSKGNQTRAAQVLGISRKALWEKRRRYGIP